MGLATDIQTLCHAFAKVERMDPDGPIYAKLIDILDRADDAALIVAHKANIRFVSKLAFNRMIRRGLVGMEG